MDLRLLGKRGALHAYALRAAGFPRIIVIARNGREAAEKLGVHRPQMQRVWDWRGPMIAGAVFRLF